MGATNASSQPLLPIWSGTGEIAGYQARPDSPRVRDGKAVKYETPRAMRMVLDVHPAARAQLADPAFPLFITEGIKKRDALVSNGICAVSWLGAWNWRDANDEGGKAVRPDWDHVALNDRQVYVAFDSDVMLKPAVHAAMPRLQGVLELRGANVAFIY